VPPSPTPLSLSFYDTSTAGSAAITNNSGGYVTFNDSSTAGSSAITNNGNLYFNGASTRRLNPQSPTAAALPF
jgi:hypothetical protein